MDFQIQHAFNYMVWNQLYVGTKDFDILFDEVKRYIKQIHCFKNTYKKIVKF